MSNFFSHFKKTAEDIRLTASERSRMQAALEKAMLEKPLIQSPIQPTPSPIFFASHRFASTVAFVLVIAVVGSGTAYAAEDALPGDVLYPVKINVNESIRTAFAVTPEARAKWHARAVERRLEEAGALAASGRLSDETKAQIEDNLETHATEVEAIAMNLEASDPVAAADVSARLESAIEAHSAVIARLADEGDDEDVRDVSRRFAVALHERARRIASVQRPATLALERKAANFETSMTMQADDVSVSATMQSDSEEEVVARLSANASTTLDQAEEKLNELQDRLSSTTSDRTRVQISRLRELIKKWREDARSDKESIQKTLNDVTKLKTFLEAQEKFKERALLPAPESETEAEIEGRVNLEGSTLEIRL